MKLYMAIERNTSVRKIQIFIWNGNIIFIINIISTMNNMAMDGIVTLLIISLYPKPRRSFILIVIKIKAIIFGIRTAMEVPEIPHRLVKG